MNMGIADIKKWPTALKTGDDLYLITDLDSGEPEYLVYSSSEKKATFVRDNGSWIKVSNKFFEEETDDLRYSTEFYGDVSVIERFDKFQAKNRSVMYSGNFKPSLTAAAEDGGATAPAADDTAGCPPATLDIAINLKNRKRAIAVARYGPLNPKEPNEDFWADKAKSWSIKPEEAKKSLCGNCVFFVITTKMKNCIATGIESGGSGEQDAWDAIDAAELGFCEAFDFKCAASRTCDAWVTGGPIKDGVESSEGAK